MTDLGIGNHAAVDTQRTWFVGGTLFLASAVLVLTVSSADMWFPGGNDIGTIIVAAALLIFAFGYRGSGSVTGRRPLGTAALVLLAVWLLLQPVLTGLFITGIEQGYLTGSFVGFGYADYLVQFTLALIAVMQIARAGVVPRPWNWAPAAALAAACTSWILLQVIAVEIGVSGGTPLRLIIAITTIDSLVRLGGTVFLGVLAIVLADRAVRPHREVPASGTVDAD
jgi:hypothetical protein